MILLVALMLASSGSAAYIKHYDDWAFNGGSHGDGIVWTGLYLKEWLSNPLSNIDAACWDWDGDGLISNCYFQEWISKYSCDHSTGGSWLIPNESGVFVPPSDLFGGHCDLRTEGDCFHTIVTSPGSWKQIREVIYFTDCTAGNAQINAVDREDYHVVYGHQYTCDAPDDKPDYEGSYGVDGSYAWVDIVKDKPLCGSNEICDGNYDQNIKFISNEAPPSPCRTKLKNNWEACSDDSECISGQCNPADINDNKVCHSCTGSQCPYDPATSCVNDGGVQSSTQMYCDAGTWRKCTGASQACQVEGSYQCLNLYGSWRWSQCAANQYCDGGLCYTLQNDWQPCTKDIQCKSGKCVWNECSPCSGTQCTSTAWNSCTARGGLCCVNDAPLVDQYYCESPAANLWAECTTSNHSGCQAKQYGGTTHYCTLEDSMWRWRACPEGCDAGTNACIYPKYPNIVVSPGSLKYYIGT